MKKAILTQEVLNQYIDLHKSLKMPYKLTLSTYTARIISNYCDIYFMKAEQPVRVFAAYNKVKLDCKKVPVAQIKTSTLQYYSTAFQHGDFYADEIYNIDIKSAYASILYNDKLISKKTYDYLIKLPKMERLASVGMLASKKHHYEIDEKGEVTLDRIERSETSDYFFYCVKRTSEIINHVSKHLGEAFLFSWVDGIYFYQNNEKASISAMKIITDYLNENNLKASYDKLTEFEVKDKKEYYHCRFLKEGKLKYFNIPKIESETKNAIINHLLTKSYN